MKKFEDLKRLAEKACSISFNYISVDRHGMEFVHSTKTNAEVIRDLIADREQLIETLKIYADRGFYAVNIMTGMNSRKRIKAARTDYGHCAREALAKSDEVENE